MLLEGPIAIIVISGVAGFIASLLTIKYITRNFIKHGIFGIDYHKPKRPEIPEMGGLAFLIGVLVASIPAVLLGFYVSETLGMMTTVLATGFVGIIDDLKKLSATMKPLLTALAGIPLILIHPYSGNLALPFGIVFRIPLVYMVLIPGLLAVVSNSINMFDTMNGTATGSSLLALITLFAAIFLKNLIWRGFDITLVVMMSALVFPSLLTLFTYNKYPAKVFVGDTGTLSIGGALTAFAIIQGCEVPLIIAMLPQLTNGFFNLSSVGRLFERSELSIRPILVSEDGKITANTDVKAPITLTRFVVALKFGNEKEIINAIMALCIFSSMLVILTIVLGWW